MLQRVAEHVMRPRRFGPKVLLRVDLHGVSSFGPGDQRTAIRWEWIEDISTTDSAVEVRSATDSVTFPTGAFGFDPPALAQRLQEAMSITRRPEIIGELGSR
ncbi:MAG TPA: hypothetical protein VF045_03920 [Acidimicrobiales bacterium]